MFPTPSAGAAVAEQFHHYLRHVHDAATESLFRAQLTNRAMTDTMDRLSFQAASALFAASLRWTAQILFE